METIETMVAEGSVTQTWDTIMANLIKNIPGYDASFYRLSGVKNAATSFYFQDGATGKLNATLYNNLLSVRGKAAETIDDVKSLDLDNANFTTDYAEVFAKIVYNLSAEDRVLQQQQAAEVSTFLKTLIPLWNAWVKSNPDAGIAKLDDKDLNVALINMTTAMYDKWFNPEYAAKVKANRAYIYENWSKFDEIFSKMPLTVPEKLVTQIKDVLQRQGVGGAITTQIALANQILTGIKNNILSPSDENGGLRLEGEDLVVPGMTFQPNDPLTVQRYLTTKPTQNQVDYEFSVQRTEDESLDVKVSAGGGIRIPILGFLSLGVIGGAKTEIFNEDYVGINYSVKISCANVMSIPNLAVTPLLYNASTGQGWMNASVLQQAIKNGTDNVNTGYRFTSLPVFDFGPDGDFGLIGGLIVGQFPSLEITFEKCDVSKVKRLFEQHVDARVSFLGIRLGGASESSTYKYNYSNETKTSITVKMNPPAPGIIPGEGGQINDSLCQLLAVNPVFPGV